MPEMQNSDLQREIARYKQELMDCYIRSGHPLRAQPSAPETPLQPSCPGSPAAAPTPSLPPQGQRPDTPPITPPRPGVPPQPPRPPRPSVPPAPQPPVTPPACPPDNRLPPAPPITRPVPPTVPPQEPEDNEIRNSPEMIAAYDAFAAANPAVGHIKVQAMTARRTLPVSRARVEIYKNFDGGRYTIAVLYTDESGQTPDVTVPTVPRSQSEAPGTPRPFASYRIAVTHPNYADLFATDVPVFEGVTSLQFADLTPTSALPAAERADYYPALPDNTL